MTDVRPCAICGNGLGRNYGRLEIRQQVSDEVNVGQTFLCGPCAELTRDAIFGGYLRRSKVSAARTGLVLTR